MNTKERLLLVILACVNFTHIMDFMIMMPLGPQLMKLFDITPQQFGFAVSSYSLTAGVSGFISAFFVDKFDRKQILLLAYIGFVVGTFACAYAPTYSMLVGARILAGLFGGMIGAQVLSIVADSVPYERRASAMGILTMAFSMASVLGVPAGLWLASLYSWHAPFMVVGSIGLVVILLIYFLVPPITGHLQKAVQNHSPFHVLTDIWASSNQRKALTLSAVLMIGHFSIIPFLAPSLVGNAAFSQDNIFLIYLVGGSLTFFTSPLVGRIADKRGKFPIFVLFALLSLIPVWLITNLWPMPLWVVLIISSMFFIFINGRMIPVQAMVSGVVSPEQRGGFMSINSSIQQLSSGVAANLGGLIVVKTVDGHLEHYNWVGYISIILVLLSIWLASRLRVTTQ